VVQTFAFWMHHAVRCHRRMLRRQVTAPPAPAVRRSAGEVSLGQRRPEPWTYPDSAKGPAHRLEFPVSARYRVARAAKHLEQRMASDLQFRVASIPLSSPSFPANCGPNVAPFRPPRAAAHATRPLGNRRHHQRGHRPGAGPRATSRTSRSRTSAIAGSGVDRQHRSTHLVPRTRPLGGDEVLVRHRQYCASVAPRAGEKSRSTEDAPSGAPHFCGRPNVSARWSRGGSTKRIPRRRRRPGTALLDRFYA
jgi:hypothetical protein